MKTLLFSILFSAFSFFAMASTTNTEPVKTMETQLTELLQNSDFFASQDLDDARIMVKFTFNQDNEIIVLSTDNRDYDKAIKSILNYKNLDLDQDLSSKIFVLPIRVEGK